MSTVRTKIENLRTQTAQELKRQGFKDEDVGFEVFLNLRYDGTDTSIMTLRPEDEDYERAFVQQYKREYGFVIEVS